MKEVQVYINGGACTCETGISIEVWRDILNDPKLTTPEILDMLTGFYNEPGHKSTYRILLDKYSPNGKLYETLNNQFGEAICRQYGLKIISENVAGEYFGIVAMNCRELESGELEWQLRSELSEALEELPELGLYVTTESQISKNLQILEDYLESREFHDFAVERIRLGRTFLVYNVGGEIHFAPSRFVGYVNCSKEKFEQCKIKDGRETNKNFIKTFGWSVVEDSNLDQLLECYCQKLGTAPKEGKHTYFLIGISLRGSELSDYERFKRLLEYFVAHYKYVKSGNKNIEGYKEYILPHIIKNDFIATGFGWKYEPILTMINGMNCYNRLPETEILLTCRNNQFGKMGPKTCYMQIAETAPAINIMLVGDGISVSALKLALYNFHTDKTWNDKAYYKINDLGLYDNNVGVTDSLKDMFDKFVKLYEDIIMDDKNLQAKKKLNGLQELLAHKKNIILQGAPGTGKTYATASIAVLMCNNDFVDYADHTKVMEEYERLCKEGQISFCTFHQSMDYEDFVEGLKPRIIGNAVEYSVEDGIFKELADKAIHNLIDSQKTDSEQIADIQTRELFERYCTHIEKQLIESDSVEFYDKSKMRIRNINRKKDGSAYSVQLAKDENSPTQGLRIDIVERDYPKFKNGEIKSYEDIKPTYSSRYSYHGNAIYYFELYKHLSDFEKTSTLHTIERKIERKNYVLIVDEINRGNVSKIFGELITLLEADKRVGGNHKINTILPYSKEEFSVPENLYIIGTMNTTDRSTGTIDYAVRRRFAFVTLESNSDAIVEWYEKKEKDKEEIMDISVKEISLALFNEINGTSKDDVNSFIFRHKAADFEIEDLKIGHSYFMANDMDTLKMKMKYEVVPLIKEYIKDGILKSHSDDEQYFEHWINAECKSFIPVNSDNTSEEEK